MSADLASAALAAERALAVGQRHPDLYATLGWHRLVIGDLAQAEAQFRAALTLSPHDPETLIGLAQTLRHQGRLRDAVLTCDAAIAASPGYADAWLERGHVLAGGGSMAMAKDSYAQVIALAPTHAAAHAGLAAILARDGESMAARDHAAQALALEPGNVIAATALAALDLETGAPAIARDLLTPLLADLTAPSAERSLLYNLIGQAHDRLGEPAQAYAGFAAANADFAALHAARFAGPGPHRELIERIFQSLAQARVADWPPVTDTPVAGAAQNHIFLLGYPRSGTTMVENVLASLPGVVALEERPTLGDADLAFLAEPGGLERCYVLTSAALMPYRTAYWQRVHAAGIAPGGGCFVDMDPLKGTRLPLIARLFPAAKVLIMRRDPRDVVWSCFRTHFALTNAAMDFATLDGAARHYDALMQLTELAREKLPLAFHEVRYESLISNFNAETQSMCAFAGLKWSEELHQFDRTARQRGVATASASQVRKGLYDGSGQWRPYAEYLAPVLPILARWIEKFGYPA